jgi:hypothetical protein
MHTEVEQQLTAAEFHGVEHIVESPVRRYVFHASVPPPSGGMILLYQNRVYEASNSQENNIDLALSVFHRLLALCRDGDHLCQIVIRMVLDDI